MNRSTSSTLEVTVTANTVNSPKFPPSDYLFKVFSPPLFLVLYLHLSLLSITYFLLSLFPPHLSLFISPISTLILIVIYTEIPDYKSFKKEKVSFGFWLYSWYVPGHCSRINDILDWFKSKHHVFGYFYSSQIWQCNHQEALSSLMVQNFSP